jgi:hypothetical protein
MPAQPQITVYISIGNSDDKLSQAKWAMFQLDVARALTTAGARYHGEWHSHPGSMWQNACWCVEIPPAAAGRLKDELGRLADVYQQESIAWAEAPTTEFLWGAWPKN